MWANGSLESRPSLLKAFTVADGESYAVMPGGLNRVADTPDDYVVTYLSGARSKDFWVTADSPDLTHQSMLDRTAFEMVQEAICQAAWSTTSSGSGVMPNALR